MTVQEDVLPGLMFITMEQWPSDVGNQMILDAGQSLEIGKDYASDFVVINPQKKITKNNKSFKVEMKLKNGTGNNVKIYRSNSQHFSSWEEVNADIEENKAVFQTSSGGVYVARSSSDAGAIAGGVIAALVIVIIIVATVVYFRRKPEKMEAISKRFRNAKRSTQHAI